MTAEKMDADDPEIMLAVMKARDFITTRLSVFRFDDKEIPESDLERLSTELSMTLTSLLDGFCDQETHQRAANRLGSFCLTLAMHAAQGVMVQVQQDFPDAAPEEKRKRADETWTWMLGLSEGWH